MGHLQLIASNLEQVANILCAQIYSASLPPAVLPSAGREMSSSLRVRGEGLVQLIEAVVCLHAAPRVQLFASVGSG